MHRFSLGQDTTSLQLNQTPRSKKDLLQRGPRALLPGGQPLKLAGIPAGSPNSVQHRCQIRLWFEAALSPGKEERASGGRAQPETPLHFPHSDESFWWFGGQLSST